MPGPYTFLWHHLWWIMDEENRIEIAPEMEAPEDVNHGSSKGSSRVIFFAALIVALAVIAAGWMIGHPSAVSFDQTYQAVLLSNGQVYFGRLEGYGTGNPVLREVYYVQSGLNDQKQPTNILLKRGKEWHGPDRMYLNPRQIIMVEPVGPGSRVYELIKDLKQQR
jgi:hypothetical protein